MSVNACRNVGRYLVMGTVAAILFSATGCQVTIPAGMVGNAEPIVVSIGLGQTGIFNVTIGTPVSNSARVTDLETPPSMPSLATLRMNSSDIVVTPISTGREVEPASAITGSLEIRYRIASADAADPCTEGVWVGTFLASVVEDQVSLDNDFLILPDAALAFVMTGAFTLCVEVEADFEGVVVLSQVFFTFNDQEAMADDTTDDGGTSDDGQPGGDDALDDDDGAVGPDAGSDDDSVQDDADGAGGDTTQDGGDSIPDDGSTDDTTPTDEDPADDGDTDDQPPDDGEPDNGLVYTNLTNDVDQNPDSSFDAFNKYGTVSGDGSVLAYLSNVDTTGEGDATPNAEVVVMVSGAKVQVTHTTEITNTAENTYDVTNFSPFVSRDGSVVVFGSDGDLLSSGVVGAEQVYLYDVAWGSLNQLSLLDTPSGGVNKDTVGGPRVSADGSVIAWIEYDTECPLFLCDSETRLRATDPQGNNLMTVVMSSDFGFSDYTLSGNGGTIAFISFNDPVGLNSSGRDQLFFMSVPDGGITQISLLTDGMAEWTPSYRTPGLNDDASLIAVWTNDPTITDTEDIVLALLDSTGGLISILARQTEDFPGMEDAFGRPRITPGGGYVSFHTRWTFGAEQRNFHADTTTGVLTEVGIGTRTVSPTITDDGSTMVIAGTGVDFFPNQRPEKNADGTNEIWSVLIQE